MTRNLDPDRLARLLGPDEPELGCDECFDQLDRYVQLEVSGQPAASLMPRLHAHLEGCPACREDHQSLLEFVRQQT